MLSIIQIDLTQIKYFRLSLVCHFAFFKLQKCLFDHFCSNDCNRFFVTDFE